MKNAYYTPVVTYIAIAAADVLRTSIGMGNQNDDTGIMPATEE